MTENPRSKPGQPPVAAGNDDPTRSLAPAGEVGAAIGPYRLLQKVGEGGMGEVWLAEQTEPIHRHVALKVIKAGMDTRQVVARFEAERQALALMDHASIAKVFDAGATPRGLPFFAMEHVKGEPITTYCDRLRLTTRDRLELFMQVCDGVQHAHHKGIIHRDLKPSNVLVTIQDRKPVPKIIDFGVAKATAQRLTDKTLLTELGALIGTPEYMSPEQAEMTGLDIDTRADVYALGMMLYELLVGALPFDPAQWREAGFDEIRRRIREVDPPLPSARVSTRGDASTESARRRSTEPQKLVNLLRGDLDWITMKALEKDRTRRYGSPSELAADIARHLRDEPVLARAPAMGYRARKFVRRHRMGVAATALIAAALTTGSIASTMAMVRARRAEAQARQEARVKGQVVDFLKDLFKVSDPSEAKGNSVTARELLDKATGTIDARLSGQPEVEADLLNIMGQVYASLGLHKPAEAAYGKAIDITRAVLGPEHRNTLVSMEDLAALYLDEGRYAEAERLLTQLIAIQRRLDSPDRSATLNNLASAYIAVSRYRDAEPLYAEAVDIDTRILGAEHPRTLVSMANLANVYELLGRHRESEELTLRVLEVEKRVFGPEDPNTLKTMSSLVNVYWGEGRHAEAEKLSSEVLAVRMRVLGPDHPHTMVSMQNLAAVYISEQRYAEAERLLQSTLESQRRVLGPRHYDVQLSMYNLACVAARSGNLRQGMIWLRQIVDSGWTDADSLAHDADLKALHGPEFDSLVDKSRHNAAAALVSARSPASPRPLPEPAPAPR